MVRHLILDLETNSRNINIADIRIFGGYDIELDKNYIISYNDSEHDYIQKEILDVHDWVITFRGLKFDVPIMERHKLKYPFWKNIDLYNVCKKRNMLIKKDGFSSFSLRNIMLELNLGDYKDDIDYAIFEKDSWTPEEIEKIIHYSKQDLKVTYKLWEFLKERFAPLAEFIPEKDVARYKHITTTAGSYAYKVICHRTGLPEYYDDSQGDDEGYEGGFVAVPSVEEARGVIIDFDFSSLYPFMNIQGNLYSHSCRPDCPNAATCDKVKWHGNDFFKVQGYYCKNRQGLVEAELKKLYLMRKEFKKNKDSREFAVKIIINSIYGISGNPRFISLYNLNTASDCTGLGRQCIKYARKIFNQEGYFVVYSDTDSAYVQVPEGKTVEDAQKVANQIAKTLAENMNMPWDEEFNFKVDAVLKYIQFFPNDDGTYKKKLYLFVTDKNELEIKGLQIKKQDCSMLSKELFKRYLKEDIIKNLSCKFDYEFVDEKIDELLKENLSLAAKKFNVKEESDYKSGTSIQLAIQRRYGSGEVRLIRNKKIGVGKGVKYCSLEEAKNFTANDIDKRMFFKELKPFIKQEITKSEGLEKYGI